MAGPCSIYSRRSAAIGSVAPSLRSSSRGRARRRSGVGWKDACGSSCGPTMTHSRTALDLAIAIESMVHSASPAATVANIANALKPGGTFVLVDDMPVENFPAHLAHDLEAVRRMWRCPVDASGERLARGLRGFRSRDRTFAGSFAADLSPSGRGNEFADRTRHQARAATGVERPADDPGSEYRRAVDRAARGRRCAANIGCCAAENAAETHAFCCHLPASSCCQYVTT